MKKITIGLFTDSFYPMSDGVITVVDNYARRLIKYANVIVFVPKYISKPFDDSIFPYKVVRCASIKVPMLDYSVSVPKMDPIFRHEIKKYKLDIVHIHSPFTVGMYGLKYAKKHNIPVIATMHSQFKQDFQKAVHFEKAADILNHNLMKVFEKCDECFAVNKEVARIYHEDYNFSYLPKVLPNATEMTYIENSKEANDYINKLYRIKPNEKVFLFVGRINTLKNILFIVDSLRILKDIDKKIKFKMLFVGTGRDEERLKEHIKMLSLDKDVILCGKVSDRKLLSYYYKRADLFLFPSKYDASSIVQVEAASQKTPTLFLENTATSSTITPDINGYISEDSASMYAKKIGSIFSNEKEYKEVCENTYKDIYHSWDDIVDNVYNIYKKYVGDKND